MQDAGLEGERGDRHRVLEQPAQVGVVARARAGRAAQLGPERVVAQEGVDQRAQVGVVHLAGEVLEEAVELVEVAVGGRQERGRVGRLGAPDRAQLDLQLVAEALDPPGDRDQVAALELAGQEVGLAEGARLDRAGAVAQLDGQVGAAAAGRQAVLARAREDPLDLGPSAQLGDRVRLLYGRHLLIVMGGPDAVGYREVTCRT